MILKNQTTGKIICKDLKICDSFKDRMFGLLLRKNPRNLLFKTRFGIHTFFLNEPIDVLILNDTFQVVTLKRNLKPNRAYFWNPKYSIIIELVKNTIDNRKIKVHNYLKIYS